MTEDSNSELSERTKDLLTEIAQESQAFDEEEVTVGELVSKMAEDYLVVLKLKNRATTEPSGDSDENLQAELSGEVAAKQASMKEEILENI